MSLLRLAVAFALAICAASHDVSSNPRPLQLCALKDPIMNPTHEVLHGQDTVWQVPSSPKAIVFLAHGWTCDPFSYFDKSPGCERCYGLPEDRSLAVDGLRRGYGIISVKSIGDHYENWPIDISPDAAVIKKILHDWRQDHSLEDVPLVVFGNSAGGFFASGLVTYLHSAALILMCCQGQNEPIEAATAETFPPTFFDYVSNEGWFDQGSVALTEPLGIRTGSSEYAALAKLGGEPSGSMTTAKDVEEAMEKLRVRGVMVDGTCAFPRPVTPLYFTERIPCMTGEDSKKIQAAYKAEGWLGDDNYLTMDPHEYEWLAPLRKWNAMPVWYDPAAPNLCARDVVCQELMKAWAFHGCTGDANDKMYSWLDSVLAVSSNTLTINAQEFHASQ